MADRTDRKIPDRTWQSNVRAGSAQLTQARKKCIGVDEDTEHAIKVAQAAVEELIGGPGSEGP